MSTSSLSHENRLSADSDAVSTPVTIAYGDGVGAEIMEATLRIIREAGAQLAVETIEIGQRVYNMGSSSGIIPSSWESLHRTKVLLKAPITPPQGKGQKSLDITLRKALGLYANILPISMARPKNKTLAPALDIVVIKENEEDLYAGIEYRQSEDSLQAIKLITRSGCERIIRCAFDYAIKHDRQKVTCMSKNTIMELTDGLFYEVFKDIAGEYSAITAEHYTIDKGAALLATTPDIFDVIVTENLYGDIITEIAAELSGAKWFSASSHIGETFAIFEPMHDSALDIADQNIANPSGMLHAAIMMLVHIGQYDAASKVHNAWYKTIEDGIHTEDMHSDESGSHKVGTSIFADEVIARMGQKPSQFTPVDYRVNDSFPVSDSDSVQRLESRCELIGFDLYIKAGDKSIDEYAALLSSMATDGLSLSNLSNKGLKVWPDVNTSKMHLTDQYRARFRMPTEKTTKNTALIELLTHAHEKNIDVIHTENLYLFDGMPGFSLSQGE